MGRFFLAFSSLATDRETSRIERCHFPCLQPKGQTRVCLSQRVPQTSALTQPKAQAGENPLRAATATESGRQRAAQSSAAWPLQTRAGLRAAQARAWLLISSLGKVFFSL